MLKNTSILIALAISLAGFCAAEEVELTGTFQVQIACADTHHEEIAMVQEAGDGRLSGKLHALNIDKNTRKKFKIGQTVTVKGKKRPYSTKKMTKGQIRKAMVEFIQDGKGMPAECSELGEIISKIQIKKPEQAAAGAHDHGELALKPVADDNEIVEVGIPAHIEVTHIEASK